MQNHYKRESESELFVYKFVVFRNNIAAFAERIICGSL